MDVVVGSVEEGEIAADLVVEVVVAEEVLEVGEEETGEVEVVWVELDLVMRDQGTGSVPFQVVGTQTLPGGKSVISARSLRKSVLLAGMVVGMMGEVAGMMEEEVGTMVEEVVDMGAAEVVDLGAEEVGVGDLEVDVVEVSVEVEEAEVLVEDGVEIEEDLVVDEEALEDVVETEEEGDLVEEEVGIEVDLVGEVEDQWAVAEGALTTDRGRISSITSKWTIELLERLDELNTQVNIHSIEPSLVAGLIFPDIVQCFLTFLSQ